MPALQPTLSVSQTISALQMISSSVSHNLADEKEAEHQQTNGEAESAVARIERLGRERPSKFKTRWAEIAFVYSILASQFMAVSGVNLV